MNSSFSMNLIFLLLVLLPLGLIIKIFCLRRLRSLFRLINLNIHSCSEWKWTSFQPKHRQCHVSSLFIQYRNRVSQVLLEVLQVLKYSYRSAILFVEDLSIAKEANYTISGQLTECAIDELMAVEEYGEVEELIKNMHESS